MDTALLEVAVQQVRDVPGCLDGGADRLSLAVPGPSGPSGSSPAAPTLGRSPEPSLVSAVVRAAGSVPVRVLLRLGEGLGLSGGELVRLTELAGEYLALGAEGVVLGFLDADLEVDADSCTALARALPDGVGWTFHRAIDTTLEPRRSWRRVLSLPGVDAVASGGSPQGLAQGYDELLALAESDPAVARRLMPAGGLRPEHVPWLVRAGVGQFHVADQVRPGGSARAYVDADHVRSWRLLLDDTARRSA